MRSSTLTRPWGLRQHLKPLTAAAWPRFSTSRLYSTIKVDKGPFLSKRVTIAAAPDSVETIISDVRGLLQSELRDKSSNSVWIAVPVEHGGTLPHLNELGFTVHHARNNEIALYKWLNPAKPDAVPEYGTHQVGVGAAVMKGQDILVVREKAWDTGWKLPGGLSNLGEDFHHTAVREVWEETGIRASFDHVIGIRHYHGMAFDRSDLYVICKMKAETDEISLDPHELAAAAWMPVEEFSEVARYPLNRYIAKLMALEASGDPRLHNRKPGLDSFAHSANSGGEIVAPSIGIAVARIQAAKGGSALFYHSCYDPSPEELGIEVLPFQE